MICSIYNGCPESRGADLPRGGSRGPSGCPESRGADLPRGGSKGPADAQPAPERPKNPHLLKDRVTVSQPDPGPSQPELPNFAAAYGG